MSGADQDLEKVCHDVQCLADSKGTPLRMIPPSRSTNLRNSVSNLRLTIILEAGSIRKR